MTETTEPPGIDPLASFRLDGKVALVTGASSGLGARFGRVLAAAGADVALVARRVDRLRVVAGSIEGAQVVVGDVARPADVERMAQEVLERFGRIDILINNAGVGDVIRAEDQELDHFIRVIQVNLIAAYHASQVVGRHMLERGAGSIINVASVLGFVSAGQFPQPGYAASKGGLVNLSRELAAQWSRRGVRVNALCPGWFHSEMTDELFSGDSGQAWIRRKTIMGRPGEAHELDGAVVWLASDASSYVTGSAIVVDGGYLAM
jgi:NAD(P)-dependent dehydrogenase (short-subunit alcohol dehydrogenase family)